MRYLVVRVCYRNEVLIFIGIYISWLDSEPDKFEVVGSSPTMPTDERKLMRSFITKLMLFEVMLKAYPQICE